MRIVKIKVINGRKYAYDMKLVWDKSQKRYRKETVYLGRVIDEEKGIYEKLNRGVGRRDFEDELILNYGDSARCMITILSYLNPPKKLNILFHFWIR